tara:strand:- start:7420 stop:7638 length:219 start_codon:yes stop_codon:yes gene_type:complete
MYKIEQFVFIYKNERLPFKTAKEAVEHFNSEGYGMSNWDIKVVYTDGTITGEFISLMTFNYMTDIQSKLNKI